MVSVTTPPQPDDGQTNALPEKPRKFRPKNREQHRIKMAMRRLVQRNRTTGFTAIRNERLVEIFQHQKVIQAIAHTDENGKCSLKPDEIEKKAFDALGSQLPALKTEKRHRRPKPSRSDNPAYRTGTR